MKENGRIINLSNLGHNYCSFNENMIERIYDNEYLLNNFLFLFLRRIYYIKEMYEAQHPLENN